MSPKSILKLYKDLSFNLETVNFIARPKIFISLKQKIEKYLLIQLLYIVQLLPIGFPSASSGLMASGLS